MRKLLFVSILFGSILFSKDEHTKSHNLTRSVLLFEQVSTGQQTYVHSQWDSLFPFWARVADNFSVPYDAYIDSVVWWGGTWQGLYPVTPEDFWIEIYLDSSGFNQPKADPVYSERVAFIEIGLDTFYFRYEAIIPPFLATYGETYWITFMATLTALPCWGNNCFFPPYWGDGQELYFKDSGVYGYPDWTSATVVFSEPYESSFQIFGTQYGIEENQIVVSNPERVSFNSPTNGILNVTIVLVSDTHVRVRIVSLNGRVIATLLDSQLPAGETAIAYRCEVPNGVYFLEVTKGNNRTAGKLVIVE
jgi:hypothetical protein